MLCVGWSEGKGRGVFARERIACGQAIERAPVVILPDDEYEHLEQTALKDYYYLWDENSVVLVLGYGSLYNHSYTPNAEFYNRLEDKVMEYIALRDIEPGEEITINYNGWADDHSPLWFETRP